MSDIFERMLAGGVIQNSDPKFHKIFKQITATKNISVSLNLASDPAEIRAPILINQKCLDWDRSHHFTRRKQINAND